LSYFLSGKLFIRKSLTSGPHLSDAARCARPARQRAAAAWLPRAALTPQHKAAVGTAHRASRLLPRSPAPVRQRVPLSVPLPSPTAPRLARAATAPTASCVPPSSRPPPRQLCRRPYRFADRAAVPTEASPIDVALLGRFPRTGAVPSQARRVAPPCAVLADRAGPRTLRRSRPSRAAPAPRMQAVPRVAAGRAAHCASGLSAVSAQWHPVKFYYFLIYSIHCKFKNLCRILFNSENYEINFVGMV
jgi:hypothetical protein